MIKFEVGKFYKVQIHEFRRIKIASMCIRVTKHTVTFQYIHNTETGYEKRVVQRRKDEMFNGLEFTDCPARRGIFSTYADEVCNKPKMWEKVK